ncbi:hypothetical protein J6590_056111 [Homalodisca vitripennis]|nr:hypothetical protein J6590_056111 [Homalodisca vitripennis]
MRAHVAESISYECHKELLICRNATSLAVESGFWVDIKRTTSFARHERGASTLNRRALSTVSCTISSRVNTPVTSCAWRLYGTSRKVHAMSTYDAAIAQRFVCKLSLSNAHSYSACFVDYEYGKSANIVAKAVFVELFAVELSYNVKKDLSIAERLHPFTPTDSQA